MKKKSPLSAFLSLFLLFTLLLTFCSAVPAHAELSWDIQIVSEDASFIGNGYCPIKVDSDGNPHIAYSGAPEASYASLNGSGWNIQQLPSYAFVHDLALDANGNPHITLGSLAYGTWNGSGWNFQTVATDYTVYSSLALDSSGNPHVAYTDGEGLKYASQNGSNWTIQTVDTSPEINSLVSLALDSSNTPYIMYSTPSSYVDRSIGGARLVNVKLAVLKNSGWSIETILAASNLGDFGNMVLDANNRPHFLATQRHYLSAETSLLLSTILYVSWDGSAWNTETVASDVDLVNIGFLALSPNDYPQIVYTTTSDKLIEHLMYARWTGATWESHIVDTQRMTRKPCYLAVDSEGNPHISYLITPSDQSYSPDTLDLMHATANLPTFPALPLLLALTAVIIGAIIVTVYFKKRKRAG